MSAPATYTDLHIHSTLKPTLVKDLESPWNQGDTYKNLGGQSMTLTRADFNKLIEADVRVVGLMLHTLERYVINRVVTSPAILSRVLNMDLQRLRSILATRPFEILQEDLRRFEAEMEAPDEQGRRVVVAKNYQHLREIVADPNQVAVLLGIEGAHNLGFEYRDANFLGEGYSRKYGLKNDRAMTEVQPAEPLSEALVDERVAFMQRHHVSLLTPNHFVYNHLATMPKAAELTGLRRLAHNPIRSLDVIGGYRGLTYLGQYFIEQCLAAGIFLDMKHCDAISRYQIYRLAERYNKPVVATHVAVSGRKTNVKNNTLLKQGEDMPRDRRRAKWFNPWDINMHDDDIVAIHQLGGIMGLILDSRVLGSMGAVQTAEQNNDWFELPFRQIEHVYNTLRAQGVPAPECFDSLAIGSDFDGFINPIQPVQSVMDYRYRPERQEATQGKSLDQGLLEKLRQYEDKFREAQLAPEAIVEKIMQRNTMDFLARNF